MKPSLEGWKVRTGIGCTLLAFVGVVGFGQAASGSSGSGARRAVATTAGGVRLESPGGPVAGSAPASGTAARTSSISVTVDRTQWAGYENAIYAPDSSTVFVAYKRFTVTPGPGYIPAELRVARSPDGGATWSIQVVDPDAIEQADTLENSVSIDGSTGDGRSTIYVAYHTRSSGLFADMKLKVARSTDGGATWSIQTVADSSAGDYNGIRVLDASTAVISAHVAGTGEGVHVFATTNGGVSWTDSPVESGIGNGYYTSVGAASKASVLVAWYNSLYPDHTDLNAGRRAGNSWQTMTVDGTPSDQDLTGLGASAWVGSAQSSWIAYEADTALGAFVRVARRGPGIPGWEIVPVQQGGFIGVNTAVHSVGTTDVYVSYWYADGTGVGRPVLAASSDGGATWVPFTIPDPRYTQIYLDSTAPSTSTQFVSYQTTDQLGQKPALRVARIQP